MARASAISDTVRPREGLGCRVLQLLSPTAWGEVSLLPRPKNASAGGSFGADWSGATPSRPSRQERPGPPPGTTKIIRNGADWTGVELPATVRARAGSRYVLTRPSNSRPGEGTYRAIGLRGWRAAAFPVKFKAPNSRTAGCRMLRPPEHCESWTSPFGGPVLTTVSQNTARTARRRYDLAFVWLGNVTHRGAPVPDVDADFHPPFCFGSAPKSSFFLKTSPDTGRFTVRRDRYRRHTLGERVSDLRLPPASRSM